MNIIDAWISDETSNEKVKKAWCIHEQWSINWRLCVCMVGVCVTLKHNEMNSSRIILFNRACSSFIQWKKNCSIMSDDYGYHHHPHFFLLLIHHNRILLSGVRKMNRKNKTKHSKKKEIFLFSYEYIMSWNHYSSLPWMNIKSIHWIK